MTDGKGCACVPHVFTNCTLDPIRFGDENITELHLYERCPECGCEKGYYHHIGCGIEICPKCREPMMKCGCQK